MTDEDGIEAIGTIIRGAHLFAAVDTGIFTTGPDPAVTATPYCWVRPKSWSVEPFEGDDTDPVRSRLVKYEIEITTRPNETAKGPEELATAVQSLIHGALLATSTSSVCEAGSYSKFGGNVHPQHRLTITGHFTYEL